MKKNNDTKDYPRYSEQLEFLNSEPHYASQKIANQSSDFPVRRTGSYRHKKSTVYNSCEHRSHEMCFALLSTFSLQRRLCKVTLQHICVLQ